MHLGRVFLHTWLLASCPGKQQAAASFSFPPHSQLSPDPYSTLWYYICNRNSLLLQWQMHSINGIMLILCQCQPDATTQMHPPHLHQMGRRRADGACGYSRGHLPAGISRCMHVVLLLGVICSFTCKAPLFMWYPWFVHAPLYLLSHINLLLWCVYCVCVIQSLFF